MKSVLVIATLIGLIAGAANAQTYRISPAKKIRSPFLKGRVLACPSTLATELPKDIKPPWWGTGGTTTLTGVRMRAAGPPGHQQDLLACDYRDGAVLVTYATLGACVIGADKKSFLCRPGTQFSR